MSRYSERQAQLKTGRQYHENVNNSITAVSFRRQAFAGFYENKNLELTIFGGDLAGLSIADAMEARTYTQDLTQEEIETKMSINCGVWEQPHLG